MKFENFVKGIEIFKKYISSEETSFCAAEHDVLYIGPPGEIEVSDDDKQSLLALGFSESEEFECWEFFT